MRFTPAALGLALVLAVTSSAVTGQAAAPIDPRSQALVELGDRAQSAGDLAEANGLYETALAVDPRNRAAFVKLGDVARRQSLPGKAIRFYRDALRLDAGDRTAIAGEGEALVQRGAVDRARANLARLATLCGEGACPERQRLAASIERGPPPAVAAAQASSTAPPPGAENRTRVVPQD